jgi:crossover junction endodeoxyribonuclease RuvC
MKNTDRIILGIDPGTNIMGFGVIRVKDRSALPVTQGVIKLNSIRDPYLKLQKIFKEIILLIDRYNPDELSIEAPFYGKNVQSMLKLGRAQGVAISAALSRDIPIFEYAPRKIKMAITGQGGASKEQVASIVCRMLKIKDVPEDLDATDGLAVAVCHFYQDRALKVEKNYNSWNDFLKKNPGRVRKD